MNGKVFLIISTIGCVACRPSTPPRPAVPEPYTSGEQLLEAMQNRYVGRWYRTVTFVHETTLFPPNADSSKSVMYEAMLLPSRVRADFDPIEQGNGTIVLGDSSYLFERGTLTERRAVVGILRQLISYDVYFLEPSTSAAKLRRLGFDLSKIRQDQWQGRRVYVVGASNADDMRSQQFWVDREHLLFVRVIGQTSDGSPATDLRFLEYEPLGRGWIARVVELYNDGRLVMRAQYRQVRIDVALDSALFDPARFTTARHWYQTTR